MAQLFSFMTLFIAPVSIRPVVWHVKSDMSDVGHLSQYVLECTVLNVWAVDVTAWSHILVSTITDNFRFINLKKNKESQTCNKTGIRNSYKQNYTIKCINIFCSICKKSISNCNFLDVSCLFETSNLQVIFWKVDKIKTTTFHRMLFTNMSLLLLCHI